MAEAKKVKIIDAEYFEEEKSVIFHFLQKNGEKIKIIFPEEDFGPLLGVDVIVPPDLIVDTCKKLIGKEVNWILEAEMDDTPNVRGNQADISKLDVMDKYPFYEAAKYTEKENEQ